MQRNGVFVTGTDTGIGKTWVSSLLIRELAQHGHTVLGMKPIASGFDENNGSWTNEDVVSLQAASNVDVPADKINRYRFKPAIAPHIAAQENAVAIEFNDIVGDVDYCCQHADFVVVEAVGGWHVPLNGYQQRDQDVAQLAELLGMPIIMVVGMRLGCINHALLTYQSIQHSQLPLCGWVANCCSPEMPRLQENIDTLKQALNTPFLATIPYLSESQSQQNKWFSKAAIRRITSNIETK